ncbi:hypothetical protein GQ44DRAFT_717218 [Phaeosphaeriaceae sp. PMI808]|nr:hypothetical protein GQ44DRAFT_717218 [Phaeosphaeriaceae sp. PMI808]
MHRVVRVRLIFLLPLASSASSITIGTSPFSSTISGSSRLIIGFAEDPSSWLVGVATVVASVVPNPARSSFG